MSVEKINQIYKCNVCSNIVEVLSAGGGTLVCCRQDMEHLTEKTEDVGKEKHIPVIDKIIGGIKVKIGSIEHPMEEKHHIQWIEVLDKEINNKKFLNPGMKPEAEFCAEDKIVARAYCNVHGLWIKI